MKQYEINTFLDIINKIPLDKLDLFLEDFKQYLLSLYFLKDIDFKNYETEMVWIDDGKKGLKIEFSEILRSVDK